MNKVVFELNQRREAQIMTVEPDSHALFVVSRSLIVTKQARIVAGEGQLLGNQAGMVEFEDKET